MINPTTAQRRLLFGCFGLILLGSFLVALTSESSALSFSRVLATLIGKGSMMENFILWELRLPRILITLFAGMALALSGALLQTVIKNDLADPGIIGINAGAGAGIAVFFLSAPLAVASHSFLLPLAGCVGACVTAALILFFSKNETSAMILNGIGFSFAMSGIMVVLMSATQREKVDFLASWLAGSIWGTSWLYTGILFVLCLVIIPFVLSKSHQLDLLRLSRETIIGLGIPLKKWRLVFIGCAVVLAGVSVSITGGISFIGLLGPHIAKALVGVKHRHFLPMALLLGGTLLLIADSIAQRLGIPTGIIVALIGAPYFIYLLIKK
ncbi:FecCD family ABC transporter permease [Brochothrix thermosphacta]|uniref:FecCD family ABC transporter permease n=1 Tax=Brochothrix thermosphacta TaxID=2756 RepID=UPI0039AFEBA0